MAVRLICLRIVGCRWWLTVDGYAIETKRANSLIDHHHLPPPFFRCTRGTRDDIKDGLLGSSQRPTHHAPITVLRFYTLVPLPVPVMDTRALTDSDLELDLVIQRYGRVIAGDNQGGGVMYVLFCSCSVRLEDKTSLLNCSCAWFYGSRHPYVIQGELRLSPLPQADPSLFDTLHFSDTAIQIGSFVAPHHAPGKSHAQAHRLTNAEFTAWHVRGSCIVIGFKVQIPEIFFAPDHEIGIGPNSRSSSESSSQSVSTTDDARSWISFPPENEGAPASKKKFRPSLLNQLSWSRKKSSSFMRSTIPKPWISYSPRNVTLAANVEIGRVQLGRTKFDRDEVVLRRWETDVMIVSSKDGGMTLDLEESPAAPRFPSP